MLTSPDPAPHRILLVDDEASFLHSARLALAADGLVNVDTLSDGRLALEKLSEKPFALVVLDLIMPQCNGMNILSDITQQHPETRVIVITANSEVESAVECMRRGALDYIVKPIRQEILTLRIRKALEHRDHLQETARLKESILSGDLRRPDAFSAILTNSESMTNLFRYAEAIAASDVPVLITGETGTGKELMARALHTLSDRKGSFVAVNAAGLSGSTLADAIFGHVKGAFTGAHQDRAGLIEEAAEGTLFLDEIGDLSLESQVLLLRLLQEKEYQPIGADHLKFSTARIIAATNHEVTRDRPFRRDLYYRLEAHRIHLPPLRERREDIPLLLLEFVRRAAEKFNRDIRHIPKEIRTLLLHYDFPGNVRELMGLALDAVSRNTSGTLSLKIFHEKTGLSTINDPALHPKTSGEFSLPKQLPSLQEMKDVLISEALLRCQGNKSLAAHLLGISRQTLIRRKKKKP